VLQADSRFAQAVEQAVARLERSTDAEIIVVAASRSGTYLDLSLIWASVGSLLAMIVLILVPVPIHPLSLVVEVAVTWLLLAWVLDGAFFVRWLAPRRRQRNQVDEAAHAEFHREAVHATPHRTGVLVYVSALEQRVEILPDLGVQGRVPPALWERAVSGFSHGELDAFLASLDRMGELLATHVPALDDDPVDLPNHPRIRK
jgi:putative membrane protein